MKFNKSRTSEEQERVKSTTPKAVTLLSKVTSTLETQEGRAQQPETDI